MTKPAHNEPGKNVPGLTDILKDSYRKLNRRHRNSALLTGSMVLLFGVSLLILTEQFFYLSPAVKISYWIGLIAISLISGYAVYSRREFNSFRKFCRKLADARSLPELTNAIDFIYNDRSENSRFFELALEQNLKKVKRADLKSSTQEYTSESTVTGKFRKFGMLSILGLIMVLVAAFTLPDSLNRSLAAWESYKKPNPFSYTVLPGSITLEQGNGFQPTIRFNGERPSNLSLAFKTDIEEEFRSRQPSERIEDSVVFASLSPNTSGTYYFEMDGYESEDFRVEVQLLPRFKSLSVAVVPPAYTGLDSTSYSYPFSTIRAYKGSTLRLSGKPNKVLERLTLIRKTVPDTVMVNSIEEESGIFTYQFELTAVDTLSFSMSDGFGLSNKNPFEFVVEPLEDEYPFVQLNRPEGNLEMKNPEDLVLEYEASDDFGLTGARLHYEIRRAFKQNAETQNTSIPLPALNRSETYEWTLNGLNPKPRDVINYWIEVSDNDQINGAKTSRTRSLTITFPSLTEFVDELENRERNAQETLQDISDSYEQMQQEYDRFKEQLQENPQGDWEQKQSVDQIKKQQEAIDEKVKELNEEFEKIRQEIDNSDLLSEESRQAYEELQKLMKEIDDPELAKALEELQKALGNVSQEELRKALENYEFNEQQYQERLKRTLELFKTLKLNSDLDKLAKAFEELAQEEKTLSEQGQNNAEEAGKQEAVQEDLENLQKELEKLSDNPPEKARGKLEQMQQETREELEQARKELQENIEQLRNNEGNEQDNNSINKQQERLEQQFNQLSQKMQNAQQQLNQQRTQVNIAALQYILHSLINLSQNQEKLSQETSQLASRSQAFVEKAREEKQIQQQFTQIADSLFKVSSEIPSFSNTINRKKNEVSNQLATAVEQLAERDKSRAIFAERQSLGGINELATMIASLLDQLQNSQGQGSGSGSMTMQQFMEQLKQMSGQQQQLNQQIQDYINDIQGDRLSKDQVERLNQMARQQNQIRKQIEELQKRGGMESGDQVLSELERLSEEMERTINDLRGGQTDPTLVKRQQNILSRMLNAEKAMQERGEEERREGTSAEEAPNSVSPDVTIEELQQRIRNLLNDPNRTKFNEDYQRLIEQYFELLRNLQTGQDTSAVN
ncbi:hypothetical protein G3570_04875 [Balneolaceae bacterium YR4-1]|uniref:DUF4175 family protein n=1 Tax=Halalkalibaculum roseum TaxID=2709311 RepID=A0A6M1SV05_9BACT|nr:DUF4175 family protein [Halalkalibaculum roseum]NGP75956.1 hypothetical protein [Halalkalibaculum roseum]